MKKILKQLTILALFIIICTSSTIAQTYEDAIKNQKPFIMYFFANTCPACTQFSPQFYSIASTYSKNITFLNVDANTNPALRVEYNINSVPTVLLVNPKNNKKVKIPHQAFNTKQGFLYSLENCLLKIK